MIKLYKTKNVVFCSVQNTMIFINIKRNKLTLLAHSNTECNPPWYIGYISHDQYGPLYRPVRCRLTIGNIDWGNQFCNFKKIKHPDHFEHSPFNRRFKAILIRIISIQMILVCSIVPQDNCIILQWIVRQWVHGPFSK